MHQKIMYAIAKRKDQCRLDGTVHLDDAYLGGERSGGKMGLCRLIKALTVSGGWKVEESPADLGVKTGTEGGLIEVGWCGNWITLLIYAGYGDIICEESVLIEPDDLKPFGGELESWKQRLEAELTRERGCTAV